MAIHPDWHMGQDFLMTNQIPVLGIDSFLSSHALRPNIITGDEAKRYFDGISYAKGASILNMIRAILGPDVFYSALHSYLDEHEYANVETPDLWRALSEASGRDMGYYMDPWAQNPGFPVVEVVENAAEGTISLRQSRYLVAEALRPIDDTTVWPIFLRIRTNNHTVNTDAVMTLREQAFQLGHRDMDFYILNADHAGLWRTSYTTERIWKLARVICDGWLSQRDIIGLIDDTCTLAPSGQQTAQNCLELVATAARTNRSGYYVWKELITSATALSNAFWFDNDISTQLHRLLHIVTAAKAHELGWQIGPDDGVVSEMFKSYMFYQAGKWGDKAVVRAAQDMFWALICASLASGNDTNSSSSRTRPTRVNAANVYDVVHPSMWTGVFCLGVQYGGDAAFEAVLDLIDQLIAPPEPASNSTLNSQNTTPVNANFLNAVFLAQACTNSSDNALKTFNRVASMARPASSPWIVNTLFSTLNESPTAVATAWDWLTSQGGWDRLAGAGLVSPTSLLQGVVPFLRSANVVSAVRTFFAARGDVVGMITAARRRSLEGVAMGMGMGMMRAQLGGDGAAFNQALGQVLAVLEQRVTWGARDAEGLREWFRRDCQS